MVEEHVVSCSQSYGSCGYLPCAPQCSQLEQGSNTDLELSELTQASLRTGECSMDVLVVAVVLQSLAHSLSCHWLCHQV